MNPCPRNRQQLAWLALDALDVPDARVLRAHLETCAGCRRYLAEMSMVKENICTAGEIEPVVEASPAFHQNLIRKLYARQPRSAAEKFSAFLRLFRWQLAVSSAAGMLLVAVFIWIAPQTARVAAIPHSARSTIVSTLNDDPSPTAGNYNLVASQSPEKLDELLNRQGNKPLPPAPTFRASGFVPDSDSYSDLLQTDPSK